MKGNSSRKNPNLDPGLSSSLAMKPRKSSSKNTKSPECTSLQAMFQENINNLNKYLETILKPELDSLIKSSKDLKKQYENLQNVLKTERIPQTISTSYGTIIKRVNKCIGNVTSVRNRANELQTTLVSIRSFKKIPTLIKRSNELVEQIKKEKERIEALNETLAKRILGKKYMLQVKRQTVRGDEFQRIIQVLIRQRALLCPGAEVGIEVSGVGQLDDAVYSKINKTETTCRFFQMKHSTKKLSLLTEAELFKCNFDNVSDGDDNDDKSNRLQNIIQGEGKKKSKKKAGLHLLMYFKSFCQIKENPNFENCIIEEVTLITNRDIAHKNIKDEKLVSLLFDKTSNSEKDECLDFKGERAQKYGLNLKEAKKEFSEILFRESQKYLLKKIDLAEIIVDEFLRKIHIVVNYPDLSELKKLTFKEVFHEEIFQPFNGTILESFMIYTEIQLLQETSEFTSNWKWKSEVDKIKKFINDLKSVSFTDSKVKNMLLTKGFHISFDNGIDISTDIQQLINDKKHQVLECRGKDTKMNISKIVHILSSPHTKALDKSKFLFCEYENLLTADFLLEAFCDGNFNLLVVMCKNITNCKEETLYTNLQEALQNSKQMIIVSENENTFTSSLKNLIGEDKYLCKSYQHGYKYLTPSCKEELRNKQIMFQMQKITFGELISNDLAENAINDNCLWDIVDKSNPVLHVSDESSFCSPGYGNEYYISREFYQKRVSYNKLVEHLHTDVFFVMGQHGMTEHKVKTVLIDNKISGQLIQKWDDQTEYKHGIVLCNYDTFSIGKIIDRMSILKQKSHLISMNVCNKLFLISSTEDLAENKLIHKEPSIKEENLDTYKELTDLGHIVVLVGDSGVGKSTTLTSIANQIRKRYTSTWVARIILRKKFIIRILKSSVKFDSPDEAISCVCKMIFTSEPQNLLETNLIKEGLKCSYKETFSFFLLIDGFNEIDEILQENLLILIKTLRDHCNVKQIWITTQNHDRVKLETKLEVSSYFLKPLNDEDQITLMARYWQTEYKKIDSTVKNNYNELCVDASVAIQQFKLSVNDEDKRRFTENSLNLRMLADILFDKDRKINCKLEIFDLYEIFVQQKFDIHRRETAPDHSSLGDEGGRRYICKEPTVKDTLFENYVRGILQQFSVKTVLNSHKTYYKGTENKLPGMDVYETFRTYVGASESELTLSKLGLLTLKNHEFDFIHHSFAQFFFCEYLIKHIFKLDYNQKRLWVQLVLSTNSFHLCRRFLDRTLGKLQESKELKKVTDNNLAGALTDILIQSKKNSAAPFKESLCHVSLFLMQWLKEKDINRYLRHILKKDFKSNNLIENNKSIEIIISYVDQISKEQSSKMLIRLYKNMHKMEAIQSFVKEENIKPLENSD